MCGIALIVRKGRRDLSGDLEGMHARLLHRGPDDRGTWQHVDESLGEACTLGMGHVRLSILDLSSKGRQPMSDGNGHVIVYNGEIYNYLELRKELEANGHKFETNTDTEVVLAAYRQWGHDCLHRFIGMWAFVLWDGSRFFISRDRLGKKPLYYFSDTSMGLLAMASEIKGFKGISGISLAPDERTVYRYLSFAEIEGLGETFFKGVREFPAGSYAYLTPGKTLEGITRFWTLSAESPDVSESEAVKEASDLLFDSVRLRLRSDAPLGLSLSGGLDSTLLLALMNEAGVSRPVVFSSSYAEPGYNEKDYFRIATTRLSCEPMYAETDVDSFIRNFDCLIYHIEQPSKLPGPFSLWRVSNLASRHVKVLIDGQGPDEISGGYMYFLPSAFRGSPLAEKIRFLPDLALTMWANRHILDQYPFTVILERVLGRTSSRRVVPVQKKWAEGFRDEEPGWTKITDLNSMLHEAVTRSSLPGLLRYGDRVNMAFGIENRSPFLDHRLVEFVSSLPPSMKIRGGTTKWIFRAVAKGRIPEEILNRRLKLGFPTPVGEWYRNILFDDTKERLAAYGSMPLFRKWIDVRAADELLHQHASGKADHQALLWRILSIGAWLKSFHQDGHPVHQ